MNNLTISIFGNKIFFEIINELKIFSKYKTKYHENIDLCFDETVKASNLAILIIDKKSEDFYGKIKLSKIPSILITKSPIKNFLYNDALVEQLIMPFNVLELDKKIVSLIAKSKFKENSLIKLNDYIIDKNERKIMKNNLELSLSEKEINFLILFSNNKEPLSRSLVLKNVWNYSLESETHTVETHIHRLRKKILEKFGDKNFIKNNNKGYYI